MYSRTNPSKIVMQGAFFTTSESYRGRSMLVEKVTIFTSSGLSADVVAASRNKILDPLISYFHEMHLV